MNKKLFFAGFALLAAVSFTSCSTDSPIDITNPNGVAPTPSTHYFGNGYDWTAIAKDYAQLQEFWALDKKDLKEALAESKANTVNILLDVSGYELKAGDVITLPDFWQTGATNGKVVNITFQGNFKNADFERAHAIDKGDVVANMKKFPVTIDADNLKGAEVNFTFNVEKFDLNIVTTEARSTFAGNYTIGYMFGAADTGKDALEVKEGTVEGIDLQSTGEYKGTFAGVWSKNSEFFTVASNGIKLASGKVAPGSKNVYLEATAWVDTWYEPNGWTNAQYKLGFVKFVQKPGTSIWLCLNGTNNNGSVTEDAIENVVGFDKADCWVWTSNKTNALKNIESIEKVSINGTTALTLKKDIFSDVNFSVATKFTTKTIDTFADVTFGALTVTVHADNQTLTFTGVNFNNAVTLQSGIKETEQTGYSEKLYQWIIDNTATGAGHFALVDDNNPILDANKDKPYVEYADTDIDYDGAGSFYKPAGSTASDDDLNAAKSAYLVLITHTDTDATTYIPEGTNVQLNSCTFKEPTTLKMNTTNTALNNIWGNKVLWDEQCWYTVYVDGTKYNWKKATDGTSISKVKFVLVPPTATE